MNTTIRTRGADINFTDQGTGSPTFLFLHYWGGSARTWSAVIADLAGSARCVALDQRGWGSSRSLDGRYDLDAMADDVEDIVAALDFQRVVLVGHSMGGKVAQIVAARKAPFLSGLVLVAPAPPHAMPVPAEQRAGMLASYQSREGVEQALHILAGRALSEAEREAVIADTLAGAPEAKSEWTDCGMVAELVGSPAAFTGPVRIVVGEKDLVEPEDRVRSILGVLFPAADVTMAGNAGHLLPIEAPSVIGEVCRSLASEWK
jgi:pimeloyl-ACP methyl ester carboxylesterase